MILSQRHNRIDTMKDYVFIGWSRNLDLAIALENQLKEKGFNCVIGGEYEHNPPDVGTRRTVHETVINQMNRCNQAILLFQNKNNNGISENLIYELGYLSAQNSYTNVHIIKIDITEDDLRLFPTDLHGVWGTNISMSDYDDDNGRVAGKIVEIFEKKQCHIKKKNKFEILNNHHFVEYEMRIHFETPTMSDYDLASEIMDYTKSAFCYQEQIDIRQKMEKFNEQMSERGNSSEELRLSVEYALVTLDLFCSTIPDKDSKSISMDEHTFNYYLDRYKSIVNRIIGKFTDDKTPDEESLNYFENVANHIGKICSDKTKDFVSNNQFEVFVLGQMLEHIAYLHHVYLYKKEEIAADDKKKYSKDGIDYCNKAIDILKVLMSNSEDEMYAKLLLSYAYKCLSSFNDNLGEKDESERNQQKSLKLRSELNTYVVNTPAIRHSLKDYIMLEYYHQVIEFVKNINENKKKKYYLIEIRKYVDERSKIDSVKSYMFKTLADDVKKYDIAIKK